MWSLIWAQLFCYHCNILGSRPPQYSGYLKWHSILIFALYAWSSKHVNMLAGVCGLVKCLGVGLELNKVTWFFKLTVDQVLVLNWIEGSCQVNLLIRDGLFGRYTDVFHYFNVLVVWDYWNSKLKVKHYKKPHAYCSYKTQVKILANT